MLNIDTQGIIEVYIPSFSGDLYGQNMEIRFMRFIRDEKQMGSLDELKKQIMEDCASITR